MTTLFYFNCWSSRDDHTTPSQLLSRWDWDNDEIWDTPFTQQKEYYHQYQKPGRYGVILEVKDEQGLMSKAYGTINVSPHENPTGMIKDRRDDQLYGTVQIGDQWWMAENLRFQVSGKMESGLVTTICLYEAESWCEQVGLLYQVTAISHDRFDDKYIQVCPDGWHIPTKEDWEELIENIGGNNKAHELVIGGSTDFNGRYLGLGDYALIGFPVPTDTIFTFKETFESMYYPSSTIPVDINEARTDIFVIKATKDNSSFWTGFMSTRYYMPVRCVKDK
ncbi:MAG: FISUMP domain-containing protein [Bacteroidota bacterium]|nr:FISUMP domain-containing protein [Bacteroidota bacterium]